MGYTYAGELITLDYYCCSDGALSLYTNSTVTDAEEQTLPLLTTFPAPEERERPSHTKESVLKADKQRFIVRGGFFKAGGAKRHLFFAGHIYKPSRTVRSESKTG